MRIGSGNLYYQSTLSGKRTPAHATAGQPHQIRPGLDNRQPADVVLSDVTGATTVGLLPAQPSDLVTQLNAAAKTHLIWPWVLAATLIAAFAIPWILVLGVPLTIWLAWRDTIRRVVVVFYEVDGPEQVRYQAVVDAFGGVMACASAWHIVAAGAVRTTYQYKVNAGASSIIRRQSLARAISAKPNIRTNIAVPTLETTGRTIYFLPDRMLVKDGRTYVDVPYRSLTMTSHEERFIEEGAIPRDSVVVRKTWKYVNKKGGPDRRFKNNRQLPIMGYGRVDLRTADGLTVLWSFSNAPAAQVFARSLSRLRY